MVDLPDVVQRNLWLVVEVAVGRTHIAIFVITESGVVLVTEVIAHPVAHILPALDGETILRAALVVVLRSAKSCQRELVSIVDTLRDIDEVVETLKIGALDIAITLAVRAEECNSPSVVHQSGGERDALLVQAVVAHAIPHRAAFLGVERASDDVDRTTHRRCGDDRSTKTALSLHRRSNFVQACPVAPINTAPLHIVDWDTVDHHSNIGSLETAHVDFGITKTTAILGCPHTGSGLEHFGELLVTKFHIDSGSRHLRESHRGFAGFGNRLSYHHVVEHCRFNLQADFAQLSGRFQLERLVTNRSDDNGLALGNFD